LGTVYSVFFSRLSFSRLNSRLPFTRQKKALRYKFRELHFQHLRTPYSILMTFPQIFTCQLEISIFPSVPTAFGVNWALGLYPFIELTESSINDSNEIKSELCKWQKYSWKSHVSIFIEAIGPFALWIGFPLVHILVHILLPDGHRGLQGVELQGTRASSYTLQGELQLNSFSSPCALLCSDVTAMLVKLSLVGNFTNILHTAFLANFLTTKITNPNCLIEIETLENFNIQKILWKCEKVQFFRVCRQLFSKQIYPTNNKCNKNNFINN